MARARQSNGERLLRRVQLGGEVPGAAFAYALLRYGFAAVFGAAGYAWAMASIRAWKEMER